MSNMSGFGGSGQPPGDGHPPQPPGGAPSPWGAAPGGQANPGAYPAQPGHGQPGYGHAPQGQMPHPGQPGHAQPYPAHPQPGHGQPYAQPPHGGQPYPGYGHPQPPPGQPHPGHGYAPPPGHGYAQPGGYPQQPGHPPPQAPSQNPFDSLGAPTNAWVPGALVSFFLPGIGLLLIGKPEYKSLGIKIFVGYVALVFGSIIFAFVMAFAGLGFLSKLVGLVLTVAPAASLIYTHDMTVKAYPHLGKPIFFKN